MKKYALLTLIFCIISSIALAQSIRKTYFVDELVNTAKPIIISPNYLTIVELYQEPDLVSSGKPALLKAELNGKKLYLSAQANAGSTDLLIEVGGVTLLFTVDIIPGKTPRRYVIELERSATAPNQTPPAAAGAQSSGQATPNSLARLNPRWLAVSVVSRVISSDLKSTQVKVSILNTFNSAVQIDLGRINLMQNKKAVQTSTQPSPASITTLEPQKPLLITLTAATTALDPMTLMWSNIVLVSTGVAYRIEWGIPNG
jgi:hypothetical protein